MRNIKSNHQAVRESVEFISSQDMKFLASRLNEKDFESLDEIIDRYVKEPSKKKGIFGFMKK